MNSISSRPSCVRGYHVSAHIGGRCTLFHSNPGCPYGCEFCTVTGFFGDSIRFRTNESIVDELLTLKARAKAEGAVISVFFVDDNFAISIKRCDQNIGVGPRIFHFITRLAFRAIYFPQTTRGAWLKVFFENRRTVFSLAKEAIGTVLTSKKRIGRDDRKPVHPSNRSTSSLTTR